MQQAADAARAVLVDLEELPALVTIDDAIAANSFMDIVHELQRGDAQKGLAASEVRIEGEVRVGGQEHFYLEPNVCVAIPCMHDASSFPSLLLLLSCEPVFKMNTAII